MTLKALREKQNLTQEQVSKLLNITIQHISFIENGQRNPSDKLKEKLAKLYKVDIADIFLAMKTTKRSLQKKQ